MKPSTWINHLAPAFGPPPAKVSNFFYWALSGSFKVLFLSGATSVLTGVVEVSAAIFLGLLVDAALSSSSENPLSKDSLPTAGSLGGSVIQADLSYWM